jgi:hypothetical protein
MKVSSQIKSPTMAIFFATVIAAPSAWSQDSAQLHFGNGQACWEGSLCVEFPVEKQVPQARQKPVRQVPKPAKHEAQKQTRAIAKAGPNTGVATEKKVSSQVPATAGAFYRYPMMYRGEAPPPMPPAVDQPYIQTSPGVWYWPAADDVRVPKVSGFEPRIEPAQVIQW